MRSKTIMVGLASMGCAACLVLAGRADSAEPGSGGAAAYKPVATVHMLMEGQGLFFRKIGDSLNNPNAPKRMKNIAFGAELLAELANVNTYNKTEADYVKWASELRATALELAGEAGKKDGQDENKMKALFTKLDATCKACHEKYQ